MSRAKASKAEKVIPQAKEATRSAVPPAIRSAESKRLKELFTEYQAAKKKEGVVVTQESFAVEHDIGGTQGILWQYLNNKNSLSLKTGLKFAKAFGVELEAFSPRLAEERRQLSAQGTEGPQPARKTALQSVLELNPLEQQLLGLYRDLKGEQKDELLAIANALHAKAHPNASTANPYGTTKKRPKVPETR